LKKGRFLSSLVRKSIRKLFSWDKNRNNWILVEFVNICRNSINVFETKEIQSEKRFRNKNFSIKFFNEKIPLQNFHKNWIFSEFWERITKRKDNFFLSFRITFASPKHFQSHYLEELKIDEWNWGQNSEKLEKSLIFRLPLSANMKEIWRKKSEKPRTLQPKGSWKFLWGQEVIFLSW